jgi:hypothetical protein
LPDILRYSSTLVSSQSQYGQKSLPIKEDFSLVDLLEKKEKWPDYQLLWSSVVHFDY